MKNNKISTTANLREMLCISITNVINGDLDLDKAKEITKLANEVTGSLNAETKALRLEMALSRDVPDIGSLKLV